METFLFEVPENPKNRKKIEDDLLIRHKKLKSKIEALKVRRQKEEVKFNQPAPTINSNSRRLAQKSETLLSLPSDHLEKAHELLINSRFFPRKAKISLEDLSLSIIKVDKPKKIDQSEVVFPLNKSKSDSFLQYPSLSNLTASSIKSSHNLSSDIANRNKLLLSLRQETINRGFLNEPEEPPCQLSIHERTQIWLEKKSEKILKLKEGLSIKAQDECTFSPKVITRNYSSLENTQRSLSVVSSYTSLYEKKKTYKSFVKNSEMGTLKSISRCSKSNSTFNSAGLRESTSSTISPVYSSLCPVKMNIGHESGYSNEFKDIVRPMVDYKNIKLLSRY